MAVRFRPNPTPAAQLERSRGTRWRHWRSRAIRTWPVGALRRDRQGHGDAVVAVAVDRAAAQAARRRSTAPSAFPRRRRPARAAPRPSSRCGRDSLTRSSAGAAHDGACLRRSAAATNSTGNSSIMSGNERFRHLDAVQRRVPHAQVADGLAAGARAVLDDDVGAHQRAARTSRPVRRGLMPTPSSTQFGARHERRRDEEERRRGKIAPAPSIVGRAQAMPAVQPRSSPRSRTIGQPNAASMRSV